MSPTTHKLFLFRTLSRLAGLFVPLFLFIGIALISPNLVAAQPVGPVGPVGPAPILKPCPDSETIETAIGKIPACNLNSFAQWFIRWAIGIGGGIAFLLILMAGFRIMSSGGNPDQIKAGKEQLTSAITGLLFIIFSVFLLQLIGVQILHIPGF